MAKSIADRFNIKFKQKLEQKLKELPEILGDEAVNFYLDSFKKEAWDGHSTEKWQKRKNPTKWGKKDETGRGLLVKTGAGRRSIQVLRVEANKVFITAGGAKAPYMRAHNFGLKGAITQKVNPFTRTVMGKKQQVRAFNRTINQNIPKRQFIGGVNQSPQLAAKLKRAIILELGKVINK